MPLTKVKADGVDLTDTFAFTGTVTGIDGGLVPITRSQSSSAVAEIVFDNLSTDYDTFVFYIAYMHPATDNVQMTMRFINSSGTVISGSGNYGSESQTHTNGQNGANSMTFMIGTPANIGATNYEGLQGALTLTNRNYAAGSSDRPPPAIHGHLSTLDGSNNQNGVNFAGSLDNSAQQAIRGIKMMFSSGNVASHDICMYGVKRAS
jgi:hypothetical protein